MMVFFGPPRSPLAAPSNRCGGSRSPAAVGMAQISCTRCTLSSWRSSMPAWASCAHSSAKVLPREPPASALLTEVARTAPVWHSDMAARAAMPATRRFNPDMVTLRGGCSGRLGTGDPERFWLRLGSKHGRGGGVVHQKVDRPARPAGSVSIDAVHWVLGAFGESGCGEDRLAVRKDA